jgi:hypothetical protein
MRRASARRPRRAKYRSICRFQKPIPKGYTFRVFDPMDKEIPPEAAAESAYNYITRRRGTENHDPLRDDEDNLVFRDAQGRQHSW